MTLALASVASAAALWGCAQPRPPAANTADVSIRSFAFDPHAVTISAGDSVRWTNLDNVTHTVTSGDPNTAGAGAVFDTTLAPGQTFTFTFLQKGTYTYFCRIHYTMPAMRGATVTVQ